MILLNLCPQIIQKHILEGRCCECLLFKCLRQRGNSISILDSQKRLEMVASGQSEKGRKNSQQNFTS